MHPCHLAHSMRAESVSTHSHFNQNPCSSSAHPHRTAHVCLDAQLKLAAASASRGTPQLAPTAVGRAVGRRGVGATHEHRHRIARGSPATRPAQSGDRRPHNRCHGRHSRALPRTFARRNCKPAIATKRQSVIPKGFAPNSFQYCGQMQAAASPHPLDCWSLHLL